MEDFEMEVIDPTASKERAMAAVDWCILREKPDLLKTVLSVHFKDSKISKFKSEWLQILKSTVRAGKLDFLMPLLQHVDDRHVTFGDVNTETGYVNIDVLLRKAVEHGHVTLASALIGRGASVNNRCHGKPLLHLALSAGHDDMVKLLVGHGSHLDAFDMRGETALTTVIARSQDKAEILPWLLEQGADPEQTLPTGKRAIHVAAANCPSSVRLLSETGCDVNAVHVVHGDTPLHVACARACEESIKYLITNGAHFNMQNNNHETPLLKLLKYATNPHDFVSKSRRTLAKRLIAIGFKMTNASETKVRSRRNKTHDIYRQLLRDIAHAPKLQELCRVTIRDNMAGSNFSRATDALDIPQHLRQYLKFK